MKKLLLSLMFVASLFTSCDDDETNYIVPNYLAGEWKVTQIGAANASNVIFYNSNSNGECAFDTFLFYEDFTFDYTDVTNNSGNCESVAVSGDYLQENKNVTLTYVTDNGGTPQTQTISLTIVYLYQNEAVFARTNANGSIQYLKVERVLFEE